MSTVPAIAAQIAGCGWSVCADFLEGDVLARLRETAIARRGAGAFRLAQVGRGAVSAVRTEVRGDHTLWLEPDDRSPPVRETLARLDLLRVTLNRALLLGLDALEAHFAVYPPGTHYGAHVDRFRDDDARVVSVVLYLNEAWAAADGGALRLYLEAPARAPWVDALPEGGTLVTFLSERFHHEVRPTRRERWSLAGWFRRRTP